MNTKKDEIMRQLNEDFVVLSEGEDGTKLVVTEDGYIYMIGALGSIFPKKFAQGRAGGKKMKG